MKDVTSTSFGLVIAFLLPGVVLLYGLSFWSGDVERLFATFLTAQSTLGLFLMVILAALALGLVITVPRYFFFECFICRHHRIESALFSKLCVSETLTAFRAVADEHYRYHQFWGGLVVVSPVLYVGWLRAHVAQLSWLAVLGTALGFVIFELFMGAAAALAYRQYGARGTEILKGAANAERMG
jgi:hypothetical protein